MSTQKENPARYKDVIGVFLFAFSIILFFAFILGGDKKYVGTIGSMLAMSLKDFMGYNCYMIPLVLFWWSIIEFRHKKFPFKYSMILGFFLMVLGGSILLHIIKDGSGGLLGDFISDVIIQITFGKIGAYLISISLILISFILMAEISVRHLVSKIKLLLLSIRESIKTGLVASSTKHDIKKIKQRKPLKIKKEKKKLNKIPAKLDADIPAVMKKNSSIAINQESDNYMIPIELLRNQPNVETKLTEEEQRAEKLQEVLQNFGIPSEIAEIRIGPSITRYEIIIPSDIKLSRIRNLDSNIAMALKAKTVRLLTPIPGKATIGVEVPAIQQEIIVMRTMIDSEEFKNFRTNLPYCLGKSVNGDLLIADLAVMPHLLLAGATGSGKSVAIHTLINSIIYKTSPENVRFLLIDPKRVELSVYNGIPHLISEVITDSNKAVKMLQYIMKEMDKRYDILSTNKVPNIDAYNEKSKTANYSRMPRLVVVIDELADLMVLAKDKVETTIVRIAQMARSVGIHLVLATQRPSVDIITGIIKANLPARIAFNVLSGVDSRTILDSNGAEKLIGKGDMLYLSSELPQPERLQGTFISRKEIEKVVEHLKTLDTDYEHIDFDEKIQETLNTTEFEDDIYPEAVSLVINKKKASISLLQRRLRIGYNRAARIIDKMEDNGIIAEENGTTKGRDVLVTEDYLDKLNWKKE